MNDATQTDWAKTLHPDLSVLVISGEQDPVGDFGKGPRSVAKELSHLWYKRRYPTSLCELTTRDSQRKRKSNGHG